jgi:hypothetical protein
MPNPWVATPVLAAAVAGWFVGSRVARAGCAPDTCPGAEFVSGLVGAIVGFVGVLVVVVLAVRSLAEWSDRGRQDPPREGPPTC